MDKTENVVAISKAQKMFQNLLLLYPNAYRRKFEHEMLITFEDIYYDRLASKQHTGLFFWLAISIDVVKSAFEEHRELIKKQGVKNYLQKTLHVNNYNIVGVILLLPFIILLGIDFLGRLVQGDFTRYNRAWYSVMSHSILYSTFNGHAYLLWISLILLPILAITLNIIPILVSIKQSKYLTVKKLFLSNPFAIAILGVGMLALLIIYGHDFFPCVVHGLLNGAVNKENIITLCRNA